MQTFQLLDLENQATEQGRPYYEFLRVPALSMGLYRLRAGMPDEQSPHQQDEVYYVLSGRAKFEVNDERELAIPGCLFYVEAGAAHRFVEIEDDLELMVFFAPAEEG